MDTKLDPLAIINQDSPVQLPLPNDIAHTDSKSHSRTGSLPSEIHDLPAHLAQESEIGEFEHQLSPEDLESLAQLGPQLAPQLPMDMPPSSDLLPHSEESLSDTEEILGQSQEPKSHSLGTLESQATHSQSHDSKSKSPVGRDKSNPHTPTNPHTPLNPHSHADSPESDSLSPESLFIHLPQNDSESDSNSQPLTESDSKHDSQSQLKLLPESEQKQDPHVITISPRTKSDHGSSIIIEPSGKMTGHNDDDDTSGSSDDDADDDGESSSDDSSDDDLQWIATEPGVLKTSNLATLSGSSMTNTFQGVPTVIDINAILASASNATSLLASSVASPVLPAVTSTGNVVICINVTSPASVISY